MERHHFFHFSNFTINQKLENSSLWLTRIFLSIFHFSVFPSNRKNAKMEYTCAHFLFFDFSAFDQKRKNRKLTPGPLNFLFFFFFFKTIIAEATTLSTSTDVKPESWRCMLLVAQYRRTLLSIRKMEKMMPFHWLISNLTFFGSAENEHKQCSSVIFAYFIFQENWKFELAGPCTDRFRFSFFTWSSSALTTPTTTPLLVNTSHLGDSLTFLALIICFSRRHPFVPAPSIYSTYRKSEPIHTI